jgi:hypothetical protein
MMECTLEAAVATLCSLCGHHKTGDLDRDPVFNEYGSAALKG